jgi:hypothetical protein
MPATITDLGRKVKAKYPGAYDDLDDADLGRKVKAKYPGAYDDFVDEPGPLPTPDEIDAAATAQASGFVEGVKMAAQGPTFDELDGTLKSRRGVETLKRPPSTGRRAWSDTPQAPPSLGQQAQEMARTMLTPSGIRESFDRGSKDLGRGLTGMVDGDKPGGRTRAATQLLQGVGGVSSVALLPGVLTGVSQAVRAGLPGVAKFSGTVLGGMAAGEAGAAGVRAGGKKLGVDPDTTELAATAVDLFADPVAIVGGVRAARPKRKPALEQEAAGAIGPRRAKTAEGVTEGLAAAREPKPKPKAVTPEPLRPPKDAPAPQPVETAPPREKPRLKKSKTLIEAEDAVQKQLDIMPADVAKMPEKERLAYRDLVYEEQRKIKARQAPKLRRPGEQQANVQSKDAGAQPIPVAEARRGGARAAGEPQPAAAPAAGSPPVAAAPKPEPKPAPAPKPKPVPKPIEAAAPPAAAARPAADVPGRAAEPSGPGAAGSPGPGPEPVRGAVAATRTSKAKTETMAVETRLEAIEADDLIASSRDDLSPDSRYDAELQPRGQERQATEARVSGILDRFDPERLGDSLEAQAGAPIVARNDNLVESGNARTLAIRRAGRVAPEKAKAYRDWLTANAESMGLDPAAVGAMKNPVLVRRRLTDLTREERLRFTREANEDIVNRQSAAQQAKLDRDRITPQMLAALDPSDALGGKKNQGFVGAFMEAVPKTERGQLIGSDGTVSADGIARIERAVLAKAYGDTPTTRSIIDGNTETHRNIKRAMTDAAPRMARLNDAVTKGDRFELGLADELSATAAKLESLREQGMSVDQYVNQQTRLPGTETPDALLADAMLLGVDAHKRAPNRLAGILERYADLVDDAGNPKQTTMFGAAEPPSKLDLWERARRAEEVAHVEKELTPLQKKLDEASAAAAATGKPAPSAKDVLGADAKKYDRMRQLKDDLEQGKPIDEASRKFQERGEMEKNPLLREQIAERQAAPKPVAKPEVKPEVKAKPSADFQPNQAVEFSTPTGPKRGKVLSTEGNFVRVQPDDFGVVLKVSKLRVKAISGNGAAASTPVSKTVDAGSSPAPRAKESADLPTLDQVNEERYQKALAGKKKLGVDPASKLRKAAESARSKAEERRNSGVFNQNPTARRAQIGDGIMAHAATEERLAKRMEALAEAQDGGAAPELLRGVDSRAMVEDLDRYARWSKPQKDPHGVAIAARTPTMPDVSLDSRERRDLLEAAKGLPGIARERENVTMGGRRVSPKGVQKIRAAIKKAGRRDPLRYGTWDGRAATYGRLTRAGIYTDAQLRKAVEEFDALTSDAAKPDPAKEKAAKLRAMESELLGVKIPGFFPTPRPVIDRMMELADIGPTSRVLEPSAGKGDIAEVARAAGAAVETFEVQGSLRNILEAKGFKPSGDFLTETPKAAPDRIVMNPPFEKGAEMAHVQRAYEVLAPGGRVVSVMSVGPFQRSDKQSAAFRAWLDDVGGETYELPQGAFTGKDAFRQTGVNTQLVVIDKPATPNVSDPRAGALRLRSRDPVAQAQAEAARTEPNPEGTVRVVRKGRERVARLFRPGERPRTKLHQMIDDAIEAAKGAWESLPSKSELKQQLISSASVIEEFVGPAKAKLGDRDPYAARRLFEGSIGKAEQIIDTELAPILGRVRKETNDVIELGVLERMDELTRVKGVKKLPDGLTPLEVNAWKDRTRDRLKREGKFDRVDQALKELRDFSRAQLRRLRHAGIISAEQYNEIVRTNQAYIPMMRIGYLTNDGPNAHIPARKFSVAGQDVLHKIVGSARELADPLESMVRNVYKAQALIDRNQVAAKLFDLQKLPEFAGQVVPLTKGQDAPRGFGAVKFYRQGEIQRYAVPERIAESMHGLGRHQSDLITRAATLGSRALRAGATGLNAVFIPPNAARDFKTLAVTQHMGVAETTYTWLSGMAEVIGRGRYYDEWARAGGSFSGFFDSMRGPRRTLGSITQSRAEKVARTVVNPLELVRLTGEIIEQAPRVGAFKRARTKLGESSAQAALRSRDATVDFAKVGESVRLLNMWVPFLNARLQGTINIAEAFREDPVRAMWAAGQVAIAPALATYYWNHANFPDVMEEIQDWEKETSTILIYGREKDKDGRYTQAVKFPRSEVDKALGSPLEAFLDYLHERDGVGWAELGLRVMSDISPVAFERDGHLSMTRLLGDILPPTLKAGAEVATETSFFTGRRIIPRNLEKAAPRDQYRADTPSAAVAIGQAVNISPMLVQQAIRSQFGAVGEQALRLASGDDPGIKRGIGRRFSGVSGGAKEDRWFRDMDAIDRKLESGKAEARRRATVLYDQLQAAPKADRAGLLRTAVTDAAAAGGRDAAQLLIDQLRTESIRRSESAALRSLRNRSVEGRAQFLKDEMQRMAPGERGAFLRDMEAARVLTPTVAEELRRLP